MATTLQEKFALLQQMKKEKELKDAKAKDTKKFDIFSIAGVTLPGASGTAGPRNSTGQGPGGAKAGQGGSSRRTGSRQSSLDTSTKPPTPVTRTSSSTSLKRGHTETTSSSAPENIPEMDEATMTTGASAISSKNPQLLSPTRSPPGVDHDRVTPETEKSGAQECPPKKLKRSSMAVRSERQALERRPSSSGSMDYAPEHDSRLGSPTRDVRGAYPRSDRKYSTDYTGSPGGDSSSISSMPLTPTPSPLHVEDFNSRTSKDGGAYIRPDIVDIRESGYERHNHLAMEAHLRGRQCHQDATAYNKIDGYDCGNQSPATSGSLSPARSRSRSPMVMSPPHRKPSFSMAMSMSPPHTTGQNAPRPKATAPPPRVIHQLPPRPRSPKLPPEVDVSGRTVSARVVTGALVPPQNLDPRAAAASSNNVRRQILSYDDL